jgi:hypothetical protein
MERTFCVNDEQNAMLAFKQIVGSTVGDTVLGTVAKERDEQYVQPNLSAVATAKNKVNELYRRGAKAKTEQEIVDLARHGLRADGKPRTVEQVEAWIVDVGGKSERKDKASTHFTLIYGGDNNQHYRHYADIFATHPLLDTDKKGALAHALRTASCEGGFDLIKYKKTKLPAGRDGGGYHLKCNTEHCHMGLRFEICEGNKLVFYCLQSDASAYGAPLHNHAVNVSNFDKVKNRKQQYVSNACSDLLETLAANPHNTAAFIMNNVNELHTRINAEALAVAEEAGDEQEVAKLSDPVRPFTDSLLKTLIKDNRADIPFDDVPAFFAHLAQRLENFGLAWTWRENSNHG